jgi:glycosyltransferase involved in cell wall biosynthesis
MFAKHLIPRRQRPYISNEIIYRLRNFIQPNLEQFFRDFDVVILYGPYTVLKKFVSPHSLCVTFEHGTLEHFCKGPYKYNIDSLAGFKNSTDIIITNQGALESIKSHGLNDINLHKSPHPSLDIGTEFFRNQRLSMIKNSQKMNYILAPSRHVMVSRIDPGKGNIEIFKAFKMLLKVNPDLKLFCIEHGDDLAYSKRFVRNFGIEKSVVWLPLQTRFNLKRLMSESICVVDQLNSSSYGTITSDALLLGVPVLTSHNCELDIQFFGECAPVLGCHSKNDIFRAVQNLLRLKVNPIIDFHVSTMWGDCYLSPEKAFEIRTSLYSRKSNESNS